MNLFVEGLEAFDMSTLFVSSYPSQGSLSVGFKTSLLFLVLIFLIPSGQGKPACRYFGHSCLGGHGKRAMMDSWNTVGTQVKPLFAPRLWQTSKERLDLRPQVLFKEWLNAHKDNQDFQNNQYNYQPNDGMTGEDITSWVKNEEDTRDPMVDNLKLSWPDSPEVEKKSENLRGIIT